MPRCRLYYFRDETGMAPVRLWQLEVYLADRQARRPFRRAINLLAALGYEARRPLVDSVRDGIHELRIRQGHVQYRILYFFGLEGEIVLAHGLRKERDIPEMDVRRALRRKSIYESDPGRFRHEQEEEEDQDA